MDNPKIILGIESSCDETSAAVMQKTEDGVKMLSNIIATSLEIQSKYGGIVPEQAAREQLKSIIPVITEALDKANIQHQELDAIAVTEGPGLIGSLLVGVETAKTLSLIWNKPLVPVHHLIGHFYANWIESTGNGTSSMYHGKKDKKQEKPLIHNTFPIPHFPAIGLLVSGGHTDLILMKDHGIYEYIGGTRDDAAGECFDKCARLLNLPYPGGPVISKLAENGHPKAFKLPRPMLNSGDFDFSFSGLKTAVGNLVKEINSESDNLIHQQANAPANRPTDAHILSNLCASIQEAIIDVIVKKTIAAVQKYNIEQIIVAGGVAANRRLVERIMNAANSIDRNVKVPPPALCTDNAAYIAAAAFYNFNPVDPLTLQANPNLSLSS